MQVEIRGHSFILHHYKAVYWVERRTLVVADLHLGKVSHFRKEGIAVPVAAINTNFVKLDELLDTFETQRMIFCGDLFHSSYNTEWELFSFWRQTHPHIEMLLVAGNHDILPAALFEQSGIRVYDEKYTEQDFAFAHHPAEEPGETYLFAGHIHPVFTLRGPGRQQLRLPCFVQGIHGMILPGFGVFTGGAEISPEEHDRVYVVSGKEVLKIG